MSEEIAQAKSARRAEMRGRLQAMSAEQRARASAQLVAKLLGEPVWTKAKSVLLFSPFGMEPDIGPLLREAMAGGKLTALPGFDAATQAYAARCIDHPADDLVAGEFGILEARPTCARAPLSRLDLVLVPGLAFDARGGRLGRGKGFYDRLLIHVRGTTCGVAFEEQMVQSIPTEPHDIRLNCILTPSRLIET